MDIALFLQFLSCIFVAFLQAIYFFVVPDAPMLLGSILIPYISPLMVYLITFMHVYIVGVMYLNIFVMYSYVGYSYVTLVLPFLAKEIRLGKKSYKSLDRLREPVILMREYRAIQVLQNIFIGLVGRFLFPLQTMATVVFVFSSFMIIKHGYEMGVVPLVLMGSWSLMALFGWSFILMAAGYLYLSGNKILNSWRCYLGWNFVGCSKKVFSKFRRSCKPIMINYGKVFIIRKVSVLIFLRGLMRGMMRALLTLKTN